MSLRARWLRLTLPCALVTCFGCGYIGPPLPPALNLPNRVTDLSAVQRGDTLVLHFTMSKMTTEALPIPNEPEVELRVGASGSRFEMDSWLANSRRIEAKAGTTDFKIPIADQTGKDLVSAVRLLNDRGRSAGWSNFVATHIDAPLARPEDLRATATANGVALVWSGAAAPLYRVYRKSGVSDFAPLGDTPSRSYLDTTAEFATSYVYFVQGLEKSGAASSESERSAEVSITPVDTFPPAVPTNLKAIVGARSVELSWDRNTEADLAGYQISRSSGEAAMQPIGGKQVGNSYSDRDIKSGHYRYAIASLDRSGNRSALSPSIEVDVP